MMKNKLVAIALSAVMLASGVAFADMNPYVGAELQAVHNNSKVKHLGNVERIDEKPLMKKHNGAGFAPLVGLQINENVGVEAGYTFLSGQKTTITALGLYNGLVTQVKQELQFKHRNVHADVLGYLPVSSDVDLIGSLGVGRLTSKVKQNVVATGGLIGTSNQTVKSSKAGVRVGAGARYKIDENLSARLMLRHQKGNKIVKSVNSVGLGLTYQF